MIENIERYINFCTSQNPGHQYIDEQFLQDIQQLSSGTWNISVGDCLPLEMTQIAIRIHSSSVHTPVFDIHSSPTQAPGN